jgi:hypothetical protein
MNREDWMLKLANRLSGKVLAGLDGEGDDEVTFRVACGFPPSEGLRVVPSHRAIGPMYSGDMTPEIMVSPAIEDPRQVALCLIEDLVKVMLNDYEGEGDARRFTRRLLPGDVLPEWARVIVDRMPAFPHAKVTVPPRTVDTTRLLLVECERGHDLYKVRLSKKALAFGSPTCPCGAVMLRP